MGEFLRRGVSGRGGGVTVLLGNSKPKALKMYSCTGSHDDLMDEGTWKY